MDELIEDGYRMHLANPAAIRQYEGLKYSADFTDATHLAQMLCLGLLPEGYIYPPQGWRVRDLSHKRMQQPTEAKRFTQRLYDLVRRVNITDLLLEVDQWTGFTRHFTHLKATRSGRPHIATDGDFW